MPRPPIERAVAGIPRVTLFKPNGVPARELEQLVLGVDELEAIRLVDLEGLTQEQAADIMGVSRQTVGRMLERGHARVAEALVHGKAILIGGGQYRVTPRQLRCLACRHLWVAVADPHEPPSCPTCGSKEVAVCWGGGPRCDGPGPGGGRGHGHGPRDQATGCRQRRTHPEENNEE